MARFMCAALVAAIALAPSIAAAQPVPPVRLSVSTAGVEANGESRLVALTADGGTAVFWSSATNLVDGDTNGANDLFVRDRDTDRDGIFDEPGAVRTVRVTLGPAGEQPGLASPIVSVNVNPILVSPDGRFVLFNTTMPFVAADTNGVSDGYLYDRDVDVDGIFDEPGAAGLTLVTTGSAGAIAVGGDSFALELRADGRYVLFRSSATNLQPIPTIRQQLYRKDRVMGHTVLVSGTPDGTPADAAFEATGTMSPDGRLVMLARGFEALVPGGVPAVGTSPWVLRDVEANTFTPIVLPSFTDRTRAAFPFVASDFPGVAGFSTDGRRAYVTAAWLRGSSFRGLGGPTFELDVASTTITKVLHGIASISGATSLTMFEMSSNLFAYPLNTTYNISRYDMISGVVTPIVSGLVCNSGYREEGGRLLYQDGHCNPTPLLLDERYGVPLPMPAPVQMGELDATGSTVYFSSADATLLPGGADTNGVSDVFAVDLLSRFDRDTDGLDDRWEIAMGLDYASSAGADGASGDPDGDGVTNQQEQTAGSHPKGASREYLAEGADNAFFKTRIALANPGPAAATAVVRFDGDDGTARSINVHVPAGGRRTVFVDAVGGTAPSFSTIVDAPAPLVTERTMSWDSTEYGAHAERASPTPSTTWFLAEGATGAFSLFYLLQNPGDTATSVTIRYLRPSPLPPITRTYTLPPRSRTTLPVEQQAPELASTDVSAAISAVEPILVERAMYRSVGGEPFAAGHASAGVTSAATSWFLAEGATGPFFDLFVLLANPNATAADVEIRYLLPGGVVRTKTYTVAGDSRRTIYVDGEDFPDIGLALANVDVSCAITSTNGVPIVVERSMWFPGLEVTPRFWTEAHNSPGSTVTAHRWVLADGEAGGAKAMQTYVLIANTSSTAGQARLTVLPELGTTPIAPSSLSPFPPVVLTVALPPNSRTTLPMHDIPGLVGARFAVLVESLGTPVADLVVERAMYWNSGTEIWAAGTELLATPIP